MLPVSVEGFAAYLDGNLSQEDMAKVESVISTDDAMHDILINCQAIDDAMINCGPLELLIPDEISSLDFEIPSIDDNIFNDGYFDFPEVTACAAELIINEATDTEDVDAHANANEDLDVLNHPRFTEDITENIDNHLTNQDGVDINDTPEFNDL